MDKLTGQEYIDHWNKRISKGPHEAGLEKNGDDTWAFVMKHFSFNPRSVLEYGCSWGRMLRRIHAQWPKAKIYGVDLCETAIEGLKASWPDKNLPTLWVRNTPPDGIKTDMIFTCTVIQHITDLAILKQVFDGFKKILKPGGKLVMFENITFEKGGGGAHMLHFGIKDYTDLWTDLVWQTGPTFLHGTNLHALLIGTRK